MSTISMEAFLLLRYITGIPFSLIGFREYKKDLKTLLQKPHYLLLMSIPVLIGVASSYFFYIGLDTLPASIALNTVSVFNIVSSTLIGVLFFNEKKSVKYYILLLPLIPLFLMLMNSSDLRITKGLMVGVVSLLGSGICFALLININRKQLAYFSIQGTIVIKGILSLMFVLIFYSRNYSDIIASLKNITILVIIITIFSSGVGLIATFLEYKSMKFLDATSIIVFNLLGPIFTTILAVTFFGEKINLIQAISMVGIVVVLYLTATEDNKINEAS